MCVWPAAAKLQRRRVAKENPGQMEELSNRGSFGEVSYCCLLRSKGTQRDNRAVRRSEMANVIRANFSIL